MWFPSSKNAMLNALLIPVRLVILIVWDIRCQWLGWHKWTHTSRHEWRDLLARYVEYEYDVCVNPWCRVMRLGSEHRKPLREVEV